MSLTSFFGTIAVSLFAAFAFAQAPAARGTTPVTKPTIQRPQVTAPAAPTAAVPAAPAPTAVAQSTAPRAPLITTAFNETAFKKLSDSGATVVLVFSAVGDAVWAKQAPALQMVLREPEFKSIPSFQVDMASTEIAEKFLVKSAATLVVMKGGVERLRSTRMINPDVIRKMLRLNTVL